MSEGSCVTEFGETLGITVISVALMYTSEGPSGTLLATVERRVTAMASFDWLRSPMLERPLAMTAVLKFLQVSILA